MKTITQDLLTENRYWTFWKSDWSNRINVYWGGKTKFSKILNDMAKKLGDETCIYERQVEIKEPDYMYA